MKKSIAWFALLVGMVVHSPPTAAQEAGTGTWIKGREQASSPVKTWFFLWPAERKQQLRGSTLSVARQVADCALKRDRRGVERFLASAQYDLAKTNYKRLKLTISNCIIAGASGGAFSRQMYLSIGTLRGLFSEAWILDFGLANLRLAPVEVSAIKDKLSNDTTPQGILQNVAWCLAQTHPGEVSAFLTAPIGSPLEKTAFSSIAPAIPTCLDRNVTLETDRNTLRLELASIAFAMQREATEGSLVAMRK